MTNGLRPASQFLSLLFVTFVQRGNHDKVRADTGQVLAWGCALQSSHSVSTHGCGCEGVCVLTWAPAMFPRDTWALRSRVANTANPPGIIPLVGMAWFLPPFTPGFQFTPHRTCSSHHLPALFFLAPFLQTKVSCQERKMRLHCFLLLCRTYSPSVSWSSNTVRFITYCPCHFSPFLLGLPPEFRSIWPVGLCPWEEARQDPRSAWALRHLESCATSEGTEQEWVSSCEALRQT